MTPILAPLRAVVDSSAPYHFARSLFGADALVRVERLVCGHEVQVPATNYAKKRRCESCR